MSTNGSKVGIVGYGQIAKQHVAVLRALGARVVAAVNRSEEGRARALAEGIPKAYADLGEMIGRERPDALLITASVLSLFEVAAKAIPYGLPILLEKPPGTSVSECLRLADLAAQHGTPVMVGLNRRFYSVYHRSLEIIGGRGAVTAVSVEWSEDPAKMIQLGHPLTVLPILTYANSLHGVDLLSFFAGPIPDPTVWGRNLSPADGVDDYRWQMALDGLAAGGARVHFASSWDAPGRWRLLVDAPGLRMVSAPLETTQVLRSGKPPIEVESLEEDRIFKPGFFAQASWFLDVARDERRIEWPACSVEEAVCSVRIAEALTDSCRPTQGGT